MDYQPTILQLTVLNGKPRGGGERLLASFTLSHAGMSVKGCTLIEQATGKVVAVGPRGSSRAGTKIMTSFSDPVLAEMIAERADAAYRALIGKSAMEA
ncbi:MAG: hypothetical protein H5U24_20285 [Thioclava marina]|jgi:hypothetical protein|uniref:hypothetical protein n=1 Tax=Thioclava marina TaxID=1915077 RepID=UPI0019B1BC9D|nr:hypothetical protein [Thioclava marina]MBC7147703.1 hypothetical protein [Thioclava marina]